MKKILSIVSSLAVALAVSADGIKAEDFTCNDAIESPFFNNHDVSLPNLSPKDQLELQDLAGEIVFEYGGEKTSALDLNGNKIDIYEYLYISYSGDEEVDYSIFVNECDLLNDENIQHCVSWDETNNRYTIRLHSFILRFPDNDGYYSAHLYFTVTVHSPGHKDLTDNCFTFVSWVVDTDGLSISGQSTNLSYLIDVKYVYSVHYCNLDGVYPIVQHDNWNKPVYAIPRLDHDYYITVIAGHRTLMSTVFGYKEETFLIPARDIDIAISRYDSIKPEFISIICKEDTYYDTYYFEGSELGGNFAIIEPNGDVYDLQSTITIDNQIVWENEIYGHLYAFNLLPFGDIYGGGHQIDVTVTDGYNSLSIDTVFEIHPVSTHLTPRSLVLELAEDMNNLIFRIDGQEIIPTDGRSYAIDRLTHDYSTTVQVGIRLTDEWREYSEWSQETVITIPARLLGDVDGDGMLNISDVTCLIDYLLSGDASEINLDNADVESDDKINIGDVTALIDLLLGGN